MTEPDALATLAEAGFDIAHAFDAGAVASQPGLGALGRGPRCGVLIGNTRALWAPFQAALRDPALAAEADPLDRYTERVIGAAFAGPTFYAHRRYGDAFLPLQHLAVATGLGALAPSHLVIHPVFGPWFALRAVVLTDAPPPPAPAPIGPPCRCGAACADALARAQRSLAWRDWLAVRDACSLAAWRYSDEQIRFHYAALWPQARSDG